MCYLLIRSVREDGREFKAAGYDDGDGKFKRLTGPEHDGLSDAELRREARREADRRGIANAINWS